MLFLSAFSVPPNTEISGEDRAILAIAVFVRFISLFDGSSGMLLRFEAHRRARELAPPDQKWSPTARQRKGK